jgi:type IV fimbrial biogenesis protein FimT
MNGGYLSRTSTPLRHGGFTLVELIVTIAIAAILAMVAAPSLQDFVIRNRTSAASNEFIGSVLRARTEAVSRNSCVTMCVSTNTSALSPSCAATTETAWGNGWVVFRNPACDASVTSPPQADDLLLVTRTLNTDYNLTGAGGLIFFSAMGQPRPTDAGAFQVRYQTSTRSSNRTICLSPLGRTLTMAYGATCP